ncbi:hypothetical protein BC941DRAFT_476745 [Chlamydoabsidia padenii]|nr:hypothetical protein BC941DRAFT_476745 [Chlamydoabsidia padenii]
MVPASTTSTQQMQGKGHAICIFWFARVQRLAGMYSLGVRGIGSYSSVSLACLEELKKNLVKKVKVQPGVRRLNSNLATHRDQTLLKLIKMLNAHNKDMLNSAYVYMKEWCESDMETWDCNDPLVYFDRDYLNKKEIWSFAWCH